MDAPTSAPRSRGRFLRVLSALMLPVILAPMAIVLQQYWCAQWCREERRSVVVINPGLTASIFGAASVTFLGLLLGFLLLTTSGAPTRNPIFIGLSGLLVLPVCLPLLPLSLPPTDIVFPGLSVVIPMVIAGLVFGMAWALGAVIWAMLTAIWQLSPADRARWAQRQQRRWLAAWGGVVLVTTIGWIVASLVAGDGRTTLFIAWIVGVCGGASIVGGSIALDHPSHDQSAHSLHEETG